MFGQLLGFVVRVQVGSASFREPPTRIRALSINYKQLVVFLVLHSGPGAIVRQYTSNTNLVLNILSESHAKTPSACMKQFTPRFE